LRRLCGAPACAALPPFCGALPGGTRGFAARPPREGAAAGGGEDAKPRAAKHAAASAPASASAPEEEAAEHAPHGPPSASTDDLSRVSAADVGKFITFSEKARP
jgi:hypothetical protein